MTQYRLFPATNGPATRVSDSASYTLGTEFYVTSAAKVIAVYLWRPGDAPTTALSVGVFQVTSSSTGTLLTSKTGLSTSLTNGWYRAAFDTPLDVSPGNRYVASVFSNTSNFYTSTAGYWAAGGLGATGLTSGILKAPQSSDTSAVGQSRYVTGGVSLGYPTIMFGSPNYWIDVEVDDGIAGPPILQESGLAILAEDGNQLLT